VATAIVAVFVAFFPAIINWFNKPKFTIILKNKEPFFHLSEIINTFLHIKRYSLRVRVENSGKTVAKNCKGKLVKIKDAKTAEEVKDFDPLVLKWVTGNDNTISLDRRESEYLGVVYTQNDKFSEGFFL
jgi:hypothetical protein